MGTNVLGPLFAIVFMCNFEKKLSDECPSEFKPLVIRSYVDDNSLFSGPSLVTRFWIIETLDTQTYLLYTSKIVTENFSSSV